MISYSFFSKPQSLKQLPLKRYLSKFSLDRLVFGTDSIHIDVRISPRVQTAVKKTVAEAMMQYSRSEYFLESGKKDPRDNSLAALKDVCTNVLLEGINTAKARSEVQVDFLGQAALAKMFKEEIDEGYRNLITEFETLIRTYELSRYYNQNELFKMKEKLTEIKHNQKRLIRRVAEEIFQVLADVNTRNLKNIREANFPAECILPDHFFSNPSLHADNVADDFLLIEAYVLMGQRADEPDNYGSLKSIIDDLLKTTDLGAEDAGEGGNETGGSDALAADGMAMDPWLWEVNNIDLLFNCFDSLEQYKKAQQRQEPKGILQAWKSRIKIQVSLLDLFYKKCKESRVLNLIVAAYEMKGIYQGYCPPLRPLQLREYLVKSGARNNIIRELKRRKLYNEKSFPLAPLKGTIRRINYSFPRQKKEHLLAFLKDFFRYHRDLANGRILKQAMGAINLVRDKNILLLAKENGLLYEFPSTEERVQEEKPVISHVILKADIRGSVDITHKLLAKGLNPASYFSLNFFDPISEIIGDYNASKVFIEGDAIILSIFENQDTVQGWYSVARACGLAIKILSIMQRYNNENQKHGLPMLELGIGICYKQSPPAYLFDGESKIMVSPAINLADRLSGCDKRLRGRLTQHDHMFNLYVFQNSRNKDIEATADDLALRYNVNGIELDRESFTKLSREVNLKRVEYRAENNETVTLHVGKVPTLSGKFHRLVVREAAILEVNPETMAVIGPTSRKYYEICTQQAIYEFINTRKQPRT